MDTTVDTVFASVCVDLFKDDGHRLLVAVQSRAMQGKVGNGLEVL